MNVAKCLLPHNGSRLGRSTLADVTPAEPLAKDYNGAAKEVSGNAFKLADVVRNLRGAGARRAADFSLLWVELPKLSANDLNLQMPRR